MQANTSRPPVDEADAMRRSLRDLVALSMLSAVWGRSEPRRIAQDLADVLCRSMSAVLVYVTLPSPHNTVPTTILRAPAVATAEHAALQHFVQAFLRDRTAAQTVATVPNPVGAGMLQFLVTPLGLGAEYGLIVTASPHEDFPTIEERLLLDVAANQAAVVLQHARANQALRDSETHFRTMADNAPTLLWVSDAAGGRTYLSKQWYEFTGRATEQDLGDGWLSNVHPDDVATATGLIQAAHSDRAAFRVDYRLRRRDGEYRWAVDSGMPRFDETRTFKGFVGAVTDVHDRKVGEGRLQVLWEAASTLLSTDDPDALMRALFAKVSRHLDVDVYFNYHVDDASNALQMVSCAGVPHDRVAEVQRLHFGESICGTVAEQRRGIVRARIQESDEPQLHLLKSLGIRAYACNPLQIEGRLIGTLSFGSRTKDEFKPDETAFLETLSHYVTVAYERLRLVERLKESDRRKDEFLATLAHELRNPLAPVRNAAQLVRQSNGDEQLLAQASAILDRQLSHMVHLIDDLMDVARITTGKLELRKARVELAAVLMNAVEASRPQIERMGHELSLSLPPPVSIDADAVRLTQVFSNILNNAAKYTDPGGRISLVGVRDGSDVVVKIRDTGVGIPRDMLPCIFDMFTQVDRSLDRSRGGLGLGLTLVKRLVELHGGEVSASSEGRGRGSEFVVRVPLALDARPGQPAAASGLPVPAATPLQIMIVDDNEDGAASLAVLLRLQGHHVAVAHDGLSALELAATMKPDAVVLDIGLPGLDGYQVAQQLRAQPWGRRVVLIAVSGWGHSKDKQRSRDAGIDYHLVKPVNPSELDTILAGRTRTHLSQLK